MREDSPVLSAVAGVFRECRCGCGRTEFILNMREKKWGQHGYVTKECWEKAIEEYKLKQKEEES